MSTSKAEDRDVSERKLLVDDIERIRQVLHTGAASKLSSDEEEEEESDEDGQEGCREVFLGSTSVNLQHQIDPQLALEQNSQVAFPGTVLEPVYVGQQSSFNAGQDSSAQGVSDVLSHHQLANSNLFPAHGSGNLCSDDYTITELQPVNCQPSTSSLPNVSYSSVSSSFTNVPSTSDPCTSLSSANQEGLNNSTWPAVDNQFFDPRDVEGLDQEEDGPFSDGEEENIEDMEMRNKIQQCLILNRDYQIAVLDELERIELALAKNKEKQLGLHQMRANKDEGKPEGHTLMKFAYPYFRDTGLVGPPDNEDTKLKRQTCQVDGYLIQEKIWNAKEKERLAEGVKMQNLENKLSPILQKIQKLELKNVKTNSDLKELEDLKAESRRIKSIPKDKLAYDLEGIDWDKISSIYVPKRTSFQCRLQWCNFDHPDVNRTPWTKDEDKKLLQLAKDPNMTWVDIAQTLQTKRTPIHCYERYQRSLNKNLLKSKWTPEDDKLLLDVVRVVGVGNWARVASFLEGRQGDQCMHRYTQTLQMVRKGKWTEEEDELLRKAIEKYGTSWNKLSEMVPGRSGPQCRERWVNALDPKIDKGAWTKIQDQKLLENVEKFGQGNWSKIARAIGNRTDNQCWRRWIVLRKDDFLYYRQNTLRKKRELVANFTGRRQERPSLRPEDLDIPDVPVVKKARGRIPLPPEESRERRRLTRQRFREKKRAEKIRAEEEAKAKMVQEAEETEAANEDEEEETEDMRDDNEEVKEVAKKPRNRKAGVNRARIQQPHSRELMKNSPTKRELMKNSPTKRRNIGEMKRKNQKGASAEDKTSAVSGFLGPFSLLLQAFSIDIPTVLKAIQNTSTNPASSHTNVTTTAEPSVSLENTAAVDEQKEQAGDATRKQQSQASHDPGKSQLPSSNISQSNMHREASDGMLENQTRGDQGRQRNLQNAESDLQLPKEKSNMGDHQGNKHPNKGKTPIGLQSARNDNGTTAAKPMSATRSATSQAPRTRAPAIPPLPPSFTTLRTFKALLQLRPELQRIAALLNPSTECGTARSPAHQPPLASACQAVPSGSHGNKESGVPRVIRDVASEKDKQTMSKSGDSETTSSEHGVVTVARAVGAKPSNNVKESTGLCVSVGNITTDDTSKTGITQLNQQVPEIAPSDRTLIQPASALQTPSNEAGHASFRADKQTNASINTSLPPHVGSGIVENNNQGPTAVTRSRAYRNSYEYKLLSSRFSSLFLWPALLSKIPVRFTSQFGPSFAQQHPPPKLSIYPKPPEETRPKKRKSGKTIQVPHPKRRHPGLAAVRMASTASFTTPAQQLCTLAKGSAIRKESNPAETAGTAAPPEEDAASTDTNEVVFAASQLVSLHSATKSRAASRAQGKRSYNTRLPVKRRRVIESSSSSSDDETFVIDERQWRSQNEDNRPARVTRQTTRRLAMVPEERVGTVTSAQGTSSSPIQQVGSNSNVNAVISIPSDSTDEAPPKSPVLVVRTRGQDDAPEQVSQVTANQNATPSKRSRNNSEACSPSTSSSSRRKNPRPLIVSTGEQEDAPEEESRATANQNATPSKRSRNNSEACNPSPSSSSKRKNPRPLIVSTEEQEDAPEEESRATANQNATPSKRSRNNSKACNPSPSSSSKRKNPRPLIVSTEEQEDAPEEESRATANQNATSSKRSGDCKLTPSRSSKRKNPRPQKNRGACWRAMLPTVSADDDDSQ